MKERKIKRNKCKHDKLAAAQQADAIAHKAGMDYSAGIAINEAKKRAVEAASNNKRNPKGTPKELLKCKYHHPRFCTVLGHSSVTSKSCFMHGTSKEERDAAMRTIMNELVTAELKAQKKSCKSI